MLSFAVNLFFVSLLCFAVAIPQPGEDGRWNARRYGDDGRYIPTDEGKYVHIPNPYIHDGRPYEHDDRPFEPYKHVDEPYVPEATVDQYKLVLVPSNDVNPYYKPGYYKNNGIKILHQKHNYDEDKYDFEFETENKIKAEEKAIVKNLNTNDEGIASSGFYEYIGPDGFKYHVEYTADENGFRPKMKRLDTPYSGKWEYVKVN